MGIRDINYLKHINALVGIRIKNKNSRLNLINFGLESLGKKYDWDFDMENESKIFCSELIYKGLLKGGLTVPITTTIINRKIISPFEILKYISTDGIKNKDYIFLVFIGNIQRDSIKYLNYTKFIKIIGNN